jgi:hypothetical protein
MWITCLVWAIARLDGQERWVIVVVASSEQPIPERWVLDRLAPDLGRTAVRRAIKRLVRDRMLAMASGLLQIARPENWAPGRITGDDLVRLEKLLGNHACGEERSAELAEPTKKDAIAQAREAARRRTAEKVFAPKVYQEEDDDSIDSSWLDVEAAPQAWPEDQVMSSSKPKPASVPAIPPHGDLGGNASATCESCDHARTLLSSEHAGYRDWAKQHLASCSQSPKGPGRPFAR